MLIFYKRPQHPSRVGATAEDEDSPQQMYKAHTYKQEKPEVNYQLHGHILASVSSAKYLGITVTDDLRWDTHIQSICDKANRTIDFLRRNLSIGSVSIKQQAYFSLVRPLVEYASTVWDPYTQANIQKLERSNGEQQDTLQVGTETPPVLATCCREALRPGGKMHVSA